MSPETMTLKQVSDALRLAYINFRSLVPQAQPAVAVRIAQLERRREELIAQQEAARVA